MDDEFSFFEASYNPEVKFDFSDTKKTINVLQKDGTVVEKEVSLLIDYIVGTELPDWSTKRLILTSDQKLFVYTSDDINNPKQPYSELQIDYNAYEVITALLNETALANISGEYSNPDIIDGGGSTLIAYNPQVYIGCSNHAPHDSSYKRLVAVLSKLFIPIDVENTQDLSADIIKIDEVWNAAQDDNPDILYETALKFYDGENVEKDVEKAIDLFMKAANQGHVDACYMLGYIFYYGDDGQKDLERAVVWLEKAAELGSSDAQYALGNIYFKGPELFKEAENFFYSYKDNNRGSYWYDQAAMQGDERAMCKLVRLYADSEEVEQYLDISAYWAYMLRQKENDCTDDLWNSMELHQYLNFDNDGNPSKPDTLDKILKDAEYWNSLGAPDIDYDMPPPIDDSLGDDVQIENAFKTEGIVKFGDRVRVISTELTDQKDLSGLEGDVTGISTPSMFPDDYYGEVVGEPENDELVSVFFNESNKTFWFAPHLLVRIESDGDMQISVESTGMTFQQDAEGNWTERTSDKPWWKFW